MVKKGKLKKKKIIYSLNILFWKLQNNFTGHGENIQE